MTVAHVAGLPIEELAIALAAGAGGVLVWARSVVQRARRSQRANGSNRRSAEAPR